MKRDSWNRATPGVTLLVCLLGAVPARAAEAPADGGEQAAVEAGATEGGGAGAAAADEAAGAKGDGPAAGDVLMGEGIDWGDEDDGVGVEEVVAPAPDKGLVRGRVTTEGSGEGVIEARVTVDGTPFSTRTDVEGRYVLELPPGTWNLRFWSDQHFPQRVEGVAVEAGGEALVDVAMAVDEGAILTVRVEADADTSRAVVQMEKRRRAAVVMDAVSAEEMGRTPDASAADAMKRVVGATVIGGRYLVVRGLGGRYTTTLLQGVGVPNPEPDMPSLPLDIFPSSLLASVTVAKTATPDLPGNFAGGALLLEARQYPRAFGLKLDVGFSGDTVSTFEEAPRYPGGSTDWLGFDDGTRALPAGIPSDEPTSALGRDERAALGRSFGRTWGAEARTLPANAKVGLSVGDTVDAFGNRLGYQASLSWGQSWQVEREHRVTLRKAGDAIDTTNFADEVSGVRKVRLGGLASLSYELGPSDDLALISLYSRNVDDRAQVVRGYDSNDRHHETTELYFIARQLTFNQLRGHHRFDRLGGLELDWQGNFARIDRDEPDTRSISYQLQDDGTKFLNKDRGGQRTFTDLVDETFGAGVDLALPLGPFRPKAGFLFSRSARDYSTRRFLFEGARAPREVLQRPPDEIFDDETIGTWFTFDENTRVADSYTADTNLIAAYAMAEVEVGGGLRVAGGARFERQVTDLAHDAPTARVPDDTRGVDGRVEEDVLPSIHLVYALGDRTNLRAAWAMTVARPQLRELSSASWYDLANDRFYYGNADIRRSRIHNADLRLEYFPGTTEVLAVSVFGKVSEDPIEEVFFTAEGSSATFTNAAAGWVFGVELEGRLGLYHFDDALRAFGLTANLTLARSEVDMGADNALMTNRRRPLHGQSPYALNLGLLYENERSGTTAQLLYNVFGPRLDVAGIQSLPDVYEEPFHRVDLVVTQGLGGGLDLKLAAVNLLDDEETFTQGDTEVSRYRPGVGASASLSWTF